MFFFFENLNLNKMMDMVQSLNIPLYKHELKLKTHFFFENLNLKKMMDMVRSLNMLDGLFMDKMQFLSWLSSCKSVKHTKRYNYFVSNTFTRNA